MQQLLLAVVLGAVAVAVAAFLRRRRRVEAPTQPRHVSPRQLDRSDFCRPDAPFLVAVFTSATCQSCASMADKAAVLASAQVAVDVLEVAAQPALHRKYAITAVPLVVVADGGGVVRASFLGPASATDLWAAVAEIRAPGSSPEPELGR